MSTPYTRVIGGTGQSTASYELPPGVFQYIQAVLVEVDTSGSGDVQPTLSITTQDGYPIADQQQSDVIDGGGSGRATWALRLADNARALLTGFLHWGVNTDAGSQGLTLDGHGPFAFSTDDNPFTLDTGEGDVTVQTAGSATNVGTITLATAAHGITISRFGNQTFDALNATLVLGTSGGSAGFTLTGPGGVSITQAGAATMSWIGNVSIASHNALNSGGSLTLRGDAGVTIGAPAGDVVAETALGISGGTGANQATRYAGATTSGAPASGTFRKGDFVVARDGHLFVCTAAGSPGTWADVGTAGSAVSSVFGRSGAVVAVAGDYYGVVASALSGATQSSRYVGATTSGAPGSGTFSTGDFIVAQNGHVFVCTSGGSPGTWVDIAVNPPRIIECKVIADNATLATGDGQIIVMIPSELNGYNLTAVAAFVTTVSSSGTPTIQLRNVTDAVDMLSTRITIDANENTSYTAATPPVIDGAHDDVATGDLIAVDVDVAGTGAKGLGVSMTFTLP